MEEFIGFVSDVSGVPLGAAKRPGACVLKLLGTSAAGFGKGFLVVRNLEKLHGPNPLARNPQEEGPTPLGLGHGS